MDTLKKSLWITASIILLFSTDLIFAQSGLTPAQLAKIESVGSVYISEDGKSAAYTLSVPADPFKENIAESTHLYLLDIATKKSIPLITDKNVRGISFRPVKNTLTYLVNGDLHEYSIEEKSFMRIFDFEQSISGYEWASDGDHIVFRASEPKPEKTSLLPYAPEIYEENLTNTWTYIQNVAKEGHTPHRIPVQGTVYSAFWSPDRSKIALAVAPSPLVDDSFMEQKILIVDHHTREVLAEVDHTGKLGSYSWSPDGSMLALVAAATINDPIAGRIKIADTKTGETEILQKDYPGMFHQLKWKNNNELYFLSSKGVQSEFGTVNVKNGEINILNNADDVIINSFAMAENGTTLLDAETPAHPDEVYMLSKNMKNTSRITNSNPWLDDVELGKQEVITYTTKDGMEIQGLLMYPVGYEEGTRYPLINVIHGGPEAHYDNGWLTTYSMAGQVATAQGFAVFYPNYRGSTGRGLDFAMSSQGDLAGAEFDDIVEGIDHLIELGLVDKDKVGVTGGSYGGYATAWMSTKYSDRFAAGVMSVGISNNISKWGTSDIPEELYHVHARKRIWDDYQGYLERSPIFHVDNAKTPLLIMHGKEDTRVDPGQSYELYRHIKTRTSTPVRLVLYPGEGHGNRKATARFDFNLRMMRWFNQYLNGEKERPDTELDIETASIDD
ncbi:MAG: S9 family peptidase [Balneola sp.]